MIDRSPNTDQGREATHPGQTLPLCAHSKAEIKRMIDEMLASEIIQPSTDPYSSPVILVTKKDGSWSFCDDYH